MLTEAGLSVQLYDPFYAPNAAVWTQRYDFITASEVVEHLHAPRKELARLFSALKPGGYLGILTQWIIDDNVFIRSRYIRDPTHVCFFSAFTCTWIARHWAVSLELPGRGVSLFRTPP
jgi:SAM-dependent methyltransferase